MNRPLKIRRQRLNLIRGQGSDHASRDELDGELCYWLGHNHRLNDWYNDFGSTADDYYIADGLDRISADQSVYENANDPALFGYRFLTDETRQLFSFDFIPDGTSRFEPR